MIRMHLQSAHKAHLFTSTSKNQKPNVQYESSLVLILAYFPVVGWLFCQRFGASINGLELQIWLAYTSTSFFCIVSEGDQFWFGFEKITATLSTRGCNNRMLFNRGCKCKPQEIRIKSQSPFIIRFEPKKWMEWVWTKTLAIFLFLLLLLVISVSG